MPHRPVVATTNTSQQVKGKPDGIMITGTGSDPQTYRGRSRGVAAMLSVPLRGLDKARSQRSQREVKLGGPTNPECTSSNMSELDVARTGITLDVY